MKKQHIKNNSKKINAPENNFVLHNALSSAINGAEKSYYYKKQRLRHPKKFINNYIWHEEYVA